jgi:hypothetical protein
VKLVLSLLFAALVALTFAAFARSDDTVKVFDGTAIRDVPFNEYLDSLVPRAKAADPVAVGACGSAAADAGDVAPVGRRVLFPRLRGRLGR